MPCRRIAPRAVARRGKPVFIGECGLDSMGRRDGLAAALRAPVGIQHALWAALVSGAMNGRMLRMLWWEDGYDRYQFKGLDLHTKYARLSAPVADFVKGVDFTGLRPVAVSHSPDLKGGAVGSDRVALAWFRDAQCVPPAWPVRRVAGQEVTLDLPGQGRDWSVEFYETGTAKLTARGSAQVQGGKITLTLPPFEDSIALKVFARYP